MIAWIAAAYIGLHADTVLATWIADGLAETRAISFGRLITGFADAFVRRGAISIDAISLAEGFAYVRRIGRTIAFVARTSSGCATEAVGAILFTDRFAMVQKVGSIAI